MLQTTTAAQSMPQLWVRVQAVGISRRTTRASTVSIGFWRLIILEKFYRDYKAKAVTSYSDLEIRLYGPRLLRNILNCQSSIRLDLASAYT